LREVRAIAGKVQVNPKSLAGYQAKDETVRLLLILNHNLPPALNPLSMGEIKIKIAILSF
jgi:hypothetical protein